jgi:hypothetical protein
MLKPAGTKTLCAAVRQCSRDRCTFPRSPSRSDVTQQLLALLAAEYGEQFLSIRLPSRRN